MPNDNKNDKMNPEQVDIMLKLLLLQRSSHLQKLNNILSSDLSNEEKFQQLAELINPVGGQSV